MDDRETGRTSDDDSDAAEDRNADASAGASDVDGKMIDTMVAIASPNEYDQGFQM